MIKILFWKKEKQKTKNKGLLGWKLPRNYASMFLIHFTITQLTGILESNVLDQKFWKEKERKEEKKAKNCKNCA